MAKQKQRENGAGTVYPRKNKNGKTIGYRGSYFTQDGKNAGMFPPRPRPRHRGRLGRLWRMQTAS
jgi:hypothetical protein